MSTPYNTESTRASGQQDWIKKLGKKVAEKVQQPSQSHHQGGPPPGYPSGPQSTPYGTNPYGAPQHQPYQGQQPYQGHPPYQGQQGPSHHAPSHGHASGGSGSGSGLQDKILQKLNDPAVQAKAKKVLAKKFAKNLGDGF